MGIFETVPPKKYLELIQQLRLIDDTFFNVCFDGDTECIKLLLHIFLERNDIFVKEVVTQRSAHNLYGRGVRFDVIAMDDNGKIYNIEIQRSNEGANPKRARFNCSLIDSREISKNTNYDEFPETWVIFITEKDIFDEKLPMYHVERSITELNKPFEDATHIIYVNGEYKEDDALGLLMQDFFCSDPSKMHYPELAKRVDFFKHENKGVITMCEIMEKLREDGRQEGLVEGRSKMATDLAIDMLRDNKPIEEIAKYSRLPLEQIQKLAQQM